MKSKFYTVFFILFSMLFATTSFSQEVFIVEGTSDSTIVTSLSSDSFSIDKYIHFYHNGSSDLNILWDVTGFSNTAAWGLNVCESAIAGGACYDITFNPDDTVPLPAGDTSYLKAQFQPRGEAGYGYIPLKLSIEGVPNSEKEFLIYLRIDSIIEIISISEISDLDFNVYPNPAIDHLTISLPQQNNVTAARVYNVLGNKVHHENLSANTRSVSIKTADFKSGVYILKLVDANNAISTSTFIVK